MKIDSHQHFWSLSRGDYGWLGPDLAPIHRDFGPSDLAPLLAAAGINKTIVVQAADTVAETEFLLDLADSSDMIAGVVGWIDMESADAVTTLERLARHAKFKGIRPMLQNLDDDTWILRPAITRVFDALTDIHLTFDALALPRHLPHLLTRLLRHPDLHCVIDHAAKPEIANGQFDPWRADMTRLARQTQCYAKFSGLVTEAAPEYALADFTPVRDVLLGEFGAHRLMFGSDWPVLNLAGSYPSWVDMAQAMTGFEGSDADAFWGGTAARFYNVS